MISVKVVLYFVYLFTDYFDEILENKPGKILTSF